MKLAMLKLMHDLFDAGSALRNWHDSSFRGYHKVTNHVKPLHEHHYEPHANRGDALPGRYVLHVTDGTP